MPQARLTERNLPAEVIQAVNRYPSSDDEVSLHTLPLNYAHCAVVPAPVNLIAASESPIKKHWANRHFHRSGLERH